MDVLVYCMAISIVPFFVFFYFLFFVTSLLLVVGYSGMVPAA